MEPEVKAGNLEIVMPNYTVPSLALNAIYPETSSLSLRARRFLDFLIERREVF